MTRISPPPHEYDRYINSPEWRSRRRRILKRWRGRCAIVPLLRATVGHHLHYDERWLWFRCGWKREEALFDVLPLSGYIHGLIHKSWLTPLIWENTIGRFVTNALLRCWALVTLAIVQVLGLLW